MGKGSSTQTTTQRPLKEAMPLINAGIDDVMGLYNSGSLTPQPFGSMLAPQGAATLQGLQGMMQTAQGANPFVDQATSAYGDIMANPTMGLDAVRENVLRQAVPAAAQYFQNSGMLNSSVAGEGIGEAASRALAPIEYGAYNDAQDRRLRAMSMAPQMAMLPYFQDQMLAGLGGQQDARAQAELMDRANVYQQTQDQDFQNALRLRDFALGYGGLGGTQTTSGGQSSGIMGILGPLLGLGSILAAPFSGGLSLGGTSLGSMGVMGSPLGLMSSTPLTFSDKRLKDDIRPVGMTMRPMPIYEYRYKWEPEGTKHVGIMSEDAPQRAVHKHPSGFDMVDYGAL